MASNTLFGSCNEAKLDLGGIYNRPDPRHYFSTLEPLDYLIPEHAKPVFSAVLETLRNARSLETVTVLDLGCSYGINAALLKYGYSMSDLYGHYGSPALSGISREALLHQDRMRLQNREADDSFHFLGMDAAGKAIRYARESGLLDDGITANLENSPLTPETAEKIQSADIIITTGCVGYITENTFGRILDALEPGRKPWVASFVLRMFPYNPISETLEAHGLVTEKLEGQTFRQRYFSSAEEQNQVLDSLEEMGLDPAGKESEGHYHAEFFLSRPQEDTDRMPLETLFETKVFANA